MSSSTHVHDVASQPLTPTRASPPPEYGRHAGSELAAVSGRRGTFVQLQLRADRGSEPLEQEADRVAAAVASGASATVTGCTGHDLAGAVTAPASVAATLASPGQPLHPRARRVLEQRLGDDLSDVRVHTDGAAAQSARAISANAYTAGSQVVFGTGTYQPSGSRAGVRLLAHEMTHVIQQRRARRGGEHPGDWDERTPIAGEIFVQRQFQTSTNPGAVPRVLTQAEIDDALEFNRLSFQPAEIPALREVLELPAEPAIVDEDFVRAVVRFQAEVDLNQDGKLGPVTASRLGREYRAQARLVEGSERAALRRSARQIERHAFTITTVTAAREVTNTGSAEYAVRWGVPDPTANGWIIQHVTFRTNKTDCTGTAVAPVNADTEYWEGWQVRDGRVFIGSSADAHRADTFGTADEGAGTRGTATITGRVAFLPGFDLREPPWGHTVPEAMALPTLTVAPPGWSDGFARLHRLTVRWDDCVAPATHSAVGVAF